MNLTFFTIRTRRSILYRDNFPAGSSGGSEYLSAMGGTNCASHIEKGDLVVPPGNYFAMGDHRGREPGQPLLGLHSAGEYLWAARCLFTGRLIPQSDQYLKTGAGDRVGFLAHVMLHFFDETRWRRTLQVVQ